MRTENKYIRNECVLSADKIRPVVTAFSSLVY